MIKLVDEHYRNSANQLISHYRKICWLADDYKNSSCALPLLLPDSTSWFYFLLPLSGSISCFHFLFPLSAFTFHFYHFGFIYFSALPLQPSYFPLPLPSSYFLQSTSYFHVALTSRFQAPLSHFYFHFPHRHRNLDFLPLIPLSLLSSKPKLKLRPSPQANATISITGSARQI